MKASFFEYYVATTALHTARMGLSVTNHNIANAATIGYSRQIAQMRANAPLKLYTGRGMIGTGSDVIGVGQIRDLYLDTKYRSETSVLGEYGAKQKQLSFLENVINGLTDTGLNSLMDNFYSSMQELSQNPSDGTYRTNMLRSAESMTEQVNLLARNLKSQQEDINTEVAATVRIMNGIGQQIRNLNEQIVRMEADGSTANDLRDYRANLLDELSKYINIETKEVVRNVQTGQKEFVVSINGYTFVDHFHVNPLMVEKRSEKLNPMDADGLYDIYFATTKQKLDIHNQYMKGELKGLIDLRDGNNGAHFTKTDTSVASFEHISVEVINKKVLYISNPSRNDLNATGVIRITNPDTGIATEYKYESFERIFSMDNNFELVDTGRVKFEFAEELPDYVVDPDAVITSGKTEDYKGIPYYLDRLNNFVRTIAKAYNEGTDRNGEPIPGVFGHIYGYDLYGDQGNLLFSYDNIKEIDRQLPMPPYNGKITNYNLITCENFRVDSEVINDPNKIATARNPVVDPDYDDILRILHAIDEYGIDNGELINLTGEFFNARQEAVLKPSSLEHRKKMIDTADSLAKYLNSFTGTWQTNWESEQGLLNNTIYNTINPTIQAVNDIGNRIVELNEEIFNLESSGAVADEQIDERLALIAELSQYVDCGYDEFNFDPPTGQMRFVVSIGNTVFVDHLDVNPLSLEERDVKLNPKDIDGLYDVCFTNPMEKPDLSIFKEATSFSELFSQRDGNNGVYFHNTSASTVTMDNSRTLTISSPSHVDLNQTGVIRIVNPSIGEDLEYRYNSFTVNDDGSVTITFDDDLPSYAASSGIQISSGQSISGTGIPYRMNMLNIFARTVATTFNEGLNLDGQALKDVIGHVNEYDLYGTHSNLFFSYAGITDDNRRLPGNGGIVQINMINSANFQVDSGVFDDPKKIALTTPKPDMADNEMVLGMLNLSSTNKLFAEGKTSDYLVSIAGELGIDIKQAINFTLNYTDVTVSIDIQRRSVSGVDLNEESVNMVKYNQIYQAAARLINVIDSVYDTMINRLGNF